MAHITPQQFVAKWSSVELKERSASQAHFLDICELVGHPSPIEADPRGEWFTFEYGVSKTDGGDGFADVWKKGYFGWEYKGRHADLEKAYRQLLTYRESLLNPPLLVVCDLGVIEIHTNFTNTPKRTTRLTYDDLLTREGFDALKAVFTDPDRFRSTQTTDQVTQSAAAEFARLAELLRSKGADPHEASHFLIRILFCLFAEDVGLLPDRLFTTLIDELRQSPEEFTEALQELFDKMATGGRYGAKRIKHFNGRLFDDAKVLEVDRETLDTLAHVARLDWSAIEPSIFGTLFERSLDPGKRSQLGAHYTSKEDILLIVEPVLMDPLRRKWEETKAKAEEQAAAWKSAKGAAATKKYNDLVSTLTEFSGEVAKTTVLDPACGSGNFLYVALRQMLDLEKEVIAFAGQYGITSWTPHVSPAQLYGIEIDEYAHELAQATIWIGYIQWLAENGFGLPGEPVLQTMENIERKDAILAVQNGGDRKEPEWPPANVIVGNPPFLGDRRMRRELGDKYTEDLRALYSTRVPGGADFVLYWFERARQQIADKMTYRCGLIGTNSIRFGANRTVLDRIAACGAVFMAWSDHSWVLEGASVRVSLVGFDNGSETVRRLDGHIVQRIHADLTATIDLTRAMKLFENDGLSFLGMMKAGPFDIDSEKAAAMIRAPINVNGRPNSDVVRPRLGAIDVTRGSRGGWVIDFATMDEAEASEYEIPFEFVREHVKPVRAKSARSSHRIRWWRYGDTRPGLREAMARLNRCIVTPEVSKHRVFVWMSPNVIPDHSCHVIARDDDYFFGVLHSRPHESWSLAVGNRMGVGNDPRYNSSRIVGTYPFPWPPGTEPQDDQRVQSIAEAARELVDKRDRWLNPEGATEAELKKRTLTNLYNQRPTWLDLAHRKLDEAVFAAYGWPTELPEEEVLERLLALNLKRASTSKT